MASVAALMRFELERGSVDDFAELLNEHWELSKQLDAGSTNTCIDQMLIACQDLICGQFIAGAGGGRFPSGNPEEGCYQESVERENARDFPG